MGETFEARSVGMFGMTQDVFFMNQSTGFRTGHTGPFQWTTDGGETWNLGGFGSNGNRFFMVDEDNLYLGANVIYKYSSGVVSADDPRMTERKDTDILIFPNPAAAHFTFSIQSEKRFT